MRVQRERQPSPPYAVALVWATMFATMVAAGSSSSPQSSRSPQPPPDRATRAESFDQIYAQGQARNAAMRTLTARFTETTTSALLVRPLTARGTLAVERPQRVILRYTEPDTRVIVIDGDMLTTTWPTRQVLNVGTTMGRVRKQFINGSAADLRHEFEIADSQAGDVAGTYFVSMTPKRKQIRETLARLDLWVDRGSWLLKSMRMVFANGETKTMTFEDVLANATLAEGAFNPGN